MCGERKLPFLWICEYSGGYGQEDNKNAINLIVNQIHDGVWVFYKVKEKTQSKKSKARRKPQ